jgi:aerobic-type carbon monoxide dehydrogenase small subunit (CoxS/CutS family)
VTRGLIELGPLPSGKAILTSRNCDFHIRANPTDADIDGEITNICRCGTYQQVRAAIHSAANA